MGNRDARAFSLMETMVVLAIILVLAAILLPVYTASKARAKVTACVSNLRQLGMREQIEDSDVRVTCPYPVNGRGYVETPDMQKETAGAVWAFCTQHLAYGPNGDIRVPLEGKFVALYGPASTRIVDASQVKRYVRSGSTWSEVEETGAIPEGSYERWRFPGETWPPEN